MGFGRRNAGGAVPPRGPRNGNPMPPPAPESSPLWPQLRRIGVGVALGLTVFFVHHFFLMPQVGHSLARRFEQSPAERVVATSKISTAGRVAGICTPPPEGVGLQPWRRDPLSSSEAMVFGEGLKVERFAKYVTCVLENARPQLCQAGTRTEVATLVKTYLSMRRSGLRSAERTVEQTSRNGDFDAVHRSLAQRPGGGASMESDRDAVRSAVLSLLEPDPMLMLSLRALFHEGLLDAHDFSGFLGLGMPDELAPIFKEPKIAGKAC